MKDVVSGKGLRFLFREKFSSGNRYPKYPPQPVVQCRGFEWNEDDNHRTVRYRGEIELPLE